MYLRAQIFYLLTSDFQKQQKNQTVLLIMMSNTEQTPGDPDPGQIDANLGAMECSIYQNYGAGEVFVQGLAGVVNQQDVEAMIRAQKKMLQRFEKTNEMLSNCNVLSQTRLERANRDFKAHSTMIVELRKDVDSVLKRIKNIKTKMAAQNPEAFRAAGGCQEPLEEEDDEYDQQIKQEKMKKQSEKGE